MGLQAQHVVGSHSLVEGGLQHPIDVIALAVPQAADTSQTVLGAVLFVASALFGIVLMRRWKPTQARDVAA